MVKINWENRPRCPDCRLEDICACLGLSFQWHAMKFDRGVVGIEIGPILDGV